MEEIVLRFWHDLLARNNGPLHFRFVLQPLVATIIAIRAGMRDAQEQRPVFFWTLLRGSSARLSLVRDLRNDVGKLFLVAVILDVLYQMIVFRWIYPAETLAVATMLAIVSYLVVRGLTNRVLSLMPIFSSNACKESPQPDSTADKTVIHSEGDVKGSAQ